MHDKHDHPRDAEADHRHQKELSQKELGKVRGRTDAQRFKRGVKKRPKARSR